MTDICMEELGREMVGRCKGLPLAIIVLGGLLCSKYSLSEWDMMNQNVKSCFKVRNNGDDDEQFGIQAVLGLSYDHLPRYLKACFLYLGLFPEDFDISVERLINLWVAEGIISSEEEEEELLEDVAYRYLRELVERYMVQVEDWDLMGRIKTCRIHDLMRDFCLKRAERDELFKIVRLNNRNVRLDSFSSSVATRVTTLTCNNIRRLSVHLNNFSGNVHLNGKEYPPYRTVIGFSLDGCSGISQELIESIVDKFELLRVLDLEEVKGFAIPANIRKLAHLRLLNLSSAYIGKLPQSIGNWRYLLTLNLDPYNSAEEIPDVLWRLEKLRHLYLPRTCGKKTKRLRFDTLNHLQTLVNFPSSIADMADLIQLVNLRKLTIRIDDNETKFNELMKILKAKNRFNHLRFLSINSYLYVESDNEEAEGMFESEEEEEIIEEEGQTYSEDDSSLNEEFDILSKSEFFEQFESEEEVVGHFRRENMEEHSMFWMEDVNDVISCCPQLHVLTRNEKIMYQKIQHSISTNWSYKKKEVASFGRDPIAYSDDDDDMLLDLVSDDKDDMLLDLDKQAKGGIDNGRQIGKLFVAKTKIAEGSDVFEGKYQYDKGVAVKRLARDYYETHPEVFENLKKLDHQNILGIQRLEKDRKYVYLILERCTCNLDDLIWMSRDPSTNQVSGDQAARAPEEDRLKKNFSLDKLRKPNGRPSPSSVSLMRDIGYALEYLHQKGIIHGNLKPKNVLLVENSSEQRLCAKLSDTGIRNPATGCGSSGWQPPEQDLGGPTIAGDLFSFGCLLFYFLTLGKHPFGDDEFERVDNIKRKEFDPENFPEEAKDLISQLLNRDPEKRPKASEVLDHPMFWTDEKRLSFLRYTSDRIDLKDKNLELENIARTVFGGGWKNKIDPEFIKHAENRRRYNYKSVGHLLQLIRDQYNHHTEFPPDIQGLVGSVPEGYNDYFASRFPKLLIEVYKVVRELYSELESSYVWVEFERPCSHNLNH